MTSASRFEPRLWLDCLLSPAQEAVTQFRLRSPSGCLTRTQVLYVSYTPGDAALQTQLANHLTLLESQGIITNWSSHHILPSSDRTQTIHQQLNTADIILLLLSANSLSDDTCYHLEIQQAMEQHQSGEARVIPILLRPVDWQGVPFSQLPLLPKNHQPVTTWPNQDQAFQEIATGIREIALELRRNAPTTGSTSDHTLKETSE